MKTKERTNETHDNARQKTNVPGQNPRADDSPEKDEHHDENRRNQYDPEVGKSLKGPGRSGQ